jgi:YidC/Oxa1 family membrane protein insertase
MMEYYRIALATLLLLTSFLMWETWQRDHARKGTPAAAEARRDMPSTADAKDLPQTADGKPAAETAAAPLTEEEAALTKSGPLVRVRTDVFDIDISPMGGDIVGARLLNYPVSINTPQQPFALMDHTANLWYVTQGGWLSGQEAPTHHSEYQVEKTSYALTDGENSLEVRLTWTSATGLSIAKIYAFQRGSYVIDLRYEVENGSTASWSGRVYEQLQRGPAKRQNGGLLTSGPMTFTGAVISSPDERYEKLDFDDMGDQPLDRNIKNGWAAMLQHYFISALIPDSAAEYHYYSKALDTPERYMIGLYGPDMNVQPGGKSSASLKLFVGPKVQRLLEKVAPGLELTTDFGLFWFIAKPLFKVIAWLKDLTGNWGWAIILVTILVKGAFYQLSAASYKSMAKMRLIQPRMNAIREMYEDDKERMQKATMELYKKEKINPLGGCLPILIQIPVFIALYWVLVESVEMRQANFIGWIKDLSAPDPYFVLPFLNGVTMFLQQKMSPSPVIDPVQQRVFQIMPVVFSVMFAFFASGLVLYWTVNNLLSIAQQWSISRRFGHLNEPAKPVEKA